jgi:hypothetical protein
MDQNTELKPAKKVKYHTIDVTKPKNYATVRKDHYWLCEDGDPTKALFHNEALQCNKDKRIAEWVLNGAYKAHDNIQVVFIEMAYVPQQ